MELIEYHICEQKLEAMERFKYFQLTGELAIPEHYCRYIIKSSAMAWLLRQENVIRIMVNALNKAIEK